MPKSNTGESDVALESETPHEHEIDLSQALVCPRCTVMRLAEADTTCPVCGFDGKPDLVKFTEGSE